MMELKVAPSQRQNNELLHKKTSDGIKNIVVQLESAASKLKRTTRRKLLENGFHSLIICVCDMNN